MRDIKCGIWNVPDTATVHDLLIQVEAMVQVANIDVRKMKWDLCLKSIRDKPQRETLKEVWTILEAASEPLTRPRIAAELRATPDDTILGKALAVASDRDNPGAPLWSRKKKPQGYFIRDRFPEFIDTSQ